MFLNEIKRRFQAAYGATAENALPYAMNAEFSRVLANEMKHYSESHDVDTISRVHGELDELKDIMVKNIGEKRFKYMCSSMNVFRVYISLFNFFPVGTFTDNKSNKLGKHSILFLRYTRFLIISSFVFISVFNAFYFFTEGLALRHLSAKIKA